MLALGLEVLRRVSTPQEYDPRGLEPIPPSPKGMQIGETVLDKERQGTMWINRLGPKNIFTSKRTLIE